MSTNFSFIKQIRCTKFLSFFILDMCRQKLAIKGCCNRDGTNSHRNATKEVKIKKANWTLNCAKLIGSKANNIGSSATPTSSSSSNINNAVQTEKSNPCICTSYKKVDEHTNPISGLLNTTGIISQSHNLISQKNPAVLLQTIPLLPNATTMGSASINLSGISRIERDNLFSIPQLQDFSRINAEDYPNEDCDETARLRRALEIAEGVEPPPGFMPSGASISINPIYNSVGVVSDNDTSSSTDTSNVSSARSSTVSAPNALTVAAIAMEAASARNNAIAPHWSITSSNDVNTLQLHMQHFIVPTEDPRIIIHSQVLIFFLIFFVIQSLQKT